MDDSFVLEETFYILSKRRSIYRVRLSPKGLCLCKEKESNGLVKTETIVAADIIGCRVMRAQGRHRGGSACACGPGAESHELQEDEGDCSAFLYIYAYVLKKPRVKAGGRRRRERMTITLRFRSYDKFADNLKEATRWRAAVRWLTRPSNCSSETINLRFIQDASISAPSSPLFGDSSSAVDPSVPRILVIVNPKSGAGRARESFQTRVAPVLAEAELPYELHVTRHPGDARHLARTRDLGVYRATIVIGGDGLLFEVVNGLLERTDWDQSLRKCHLAIIPGGSGNGLARSLAYYSNEPYDSDPVLVSTLHAIRGEPTPMDLARVETQASIAFAFLSIGWGLISDIDIESERLRAIGGQRFTVWSVARLIGLRRYSGRVWYRPSNTSVGNNISINSKENVLKENANSILSASRSCHSSLVENTDLITEEGDFQDCIGDTLDLGTTLGCVTLEDVDEEGNGSQPEGRPRLDSYYSAASKRSAYYSAAAESADWRSIGGGSLHGVTSSTNGRVLGPPGTLPALTQPLSGPEWRLLEGEFVMVHATLQSHLASDCLFAPQAQIDDGILWLLVIHAGVSRTQLLHFLLGLSSGTHLNCPHLQVLPVTAFRIEPDLNGPRGYLTVDGEAVDYGPIQAEVAPGLARMLQRPPPPPAPTSSAGNAPS